jgi:hypothetical protein
MKENRIPSCEWKPDENDGSWDTGCGNKFTFTEEGFVGNSFIYCMYCGEPIVVCEDEDHETSQDHP